MRYPAWWCVWRFSVHFLAFNDDHIFRAHLREWTYRVLIKIVCIFFVVLFFVRFFFSEIQTQLTLSSYMITHGLSDTLDILLKLGKGSVIRLNAAINFTVLDYRLPLAITPGHCRVLVPALWHLVIRRHKKKNSIERLLALTKLWLLMTNTQQIWFLDQLKWHSTFLFHNDDCNLQYGKIFSTHRVFKNF